MYWDIDSGEAEQSSKIVCNTRYTILKKSIAQHVLNDNQFRTINNNN